MEITLINFKCYSEKTISFGEKGIILISGRSGIGKTTIVEGIFWCLYGLGRNIIKFGRTKCKVIFKIDDMKITRTKRPNRLILEIDGKIYEDKTAQHIIIGKFGKDFKNTSYISQNSSKSFVKLTPNEKLQFLENFLFENSNISTIKTDITNLNNNIKDELKEIQYELKVNKDVFKDIKKPNYVEFPIKTVNIDKTIKNEKIRYKNSHILLQRQSKRIKELNNELIHSEKYEETISNGKLLIDNLENELKQFDNMDDEPKLIEDMKGELEKNKNKLSYIKANKHIQDLKNQLENDTNKLSQLKHNELSQIDKRIKEISSILWKKYTHKEVVSKIDMNRKKISYIEQLNILKHKLVKYTKYHSIDINSMEKELIDKKEILHQLIQSKNVYKCPECKSNLKFNNDKLIHISNSISSELYEKYNEENLTYDIKQLHSKLNVTRKNHNKYNEISDDIQEIQNNDIFGGSDIPDKNIVSKRLDKCIKYEMKHINMENELNDIKHNKYNKKFPSYIIQLENNINEIANEIKNSKSSRDLIIENEDVIRNKIEELHKNIGKLIYNFKHKTQLRSQKDSITKQLKEHLITHINLFGSYRTSLDLKYIIDNERNTLIQLKDKRNKHQSNLKCIDEYTQYMISNTKYVEFKNKIDSLEKKEIQLLGRYKNSLLLRDSVLTAESICIQNMIDSINNNLQNILNVFFNDKHLGITLKTFKENKKGLTKPVINLEILYGTQLIPIESLSGGELDRVILAFTLAISNIFNSKLLIIDEATSSLDQEIHTNIIDGIRDLYMGKIVIMIAHQVSTGTFDKIILCT